ncbi:MAG: WbqC family protein [Bacteroidota bacterium]
MINKVLSIHQPNFIPWLGFFYKIALSDIFVILDTVQYPRGKSVANRNKIKSPNGIIELVVPITRPKGQEGKASYKEVAFADKKWSRKALKTIQNSYSKAPFFESYYNYLSELFQHDSFSEMNIKFIYDTVEKLGLSTQIIKLSDFATSAFGQKNDLIINLCKETGASIYLSGMGAKKYNNQELLNKNNITLKYMEYQHPEYPQINGEFISHLSIIDLFFNTGDGAKNYFTNNKANFNKGGLTNK